MACLCAEISDPYCPDRELRLIQLNPIPKIADKYVVTISISASFNKFILVSLEYMTVIY